MKKKKQLLWLQAACFPVNIGVCGSKEAWDDLMGRMSVKDEPYNTDAAGRCTRFEKSGETVTIVLTFDTRRFKKASLMQILGLVTHECVHAWQYTLEAMAEDSPGREVEAYAIQALVQDTMNALKDMGHVKL